MCQNCPHSLKSGPFMGKRGEKADIKQKKQVGLYSEMRGAVRVEKAPKAIPRAAEPHAD